MSVTETDALTAMVVTVKFALVDPAGTVTLVGTLAAVELSASVTTAPPEGAAAVKVTVPVEDLPPATLVGLTDTEDKDAAVVDAGFTVSVADRNTPPSDAVMLTKVEAVTELVVSVKLALVAPAATVTLAGTLTAAEASESETSTPPLGAAALKVTVPVEELPPTTLVGLSDSVERVGVVAAAGFTVKTPETAPLPEADAEMVARLVAVTVPVVTVKLALLAPAGTVTLDGTAAAAELSVSDTTTPPEGAAALKLTVAVEELPPTTLVGLSLSAESVTAGATPGVMSKSAWRSVPAKVAEMFRLNCKLTGVVAIAKLALVDPAGTVTL